jgi:hypothetical protein
MALQLGALRDALLDAGAKPDKADKAAEEVAYWRAVAGARLGPWGGMLLVLAGYVLGLATGLLSLLLVRAG